MQHLLCVILAQGFIYVKKVYSVILFHKFFICIYLSVIMLTSFLKPDWFLGWDIFFELVFFLITIFVSFFAFKIYLLCKNNKVRVLSSGFFFIALAYLWLMLADISAFFVLRSDLPLALKFLNVSNLFNLGIYLYMIFFIMGLCILAFLTFKEHSVSVFTLIVIPPYLALIFSFHKLLWFFLYSAFMVGFLIFYYFKTYSSNHQKNTLYLFWGFACILCSMFIFALGAMHSLLFFIGYLVEFIGYLFILLSLVKVIKK